MAFTRSRVRSPSAPPNPSTTSRVLEAGGSAPGLFYFSDLGRSGTSRNPAQQRRSPARRLGSDVVPAAPPQDGGPDVRDLWRAAEDASLRRCRSHPNSSTTCAATALATLHGRSP